MSSTVVGTHSGAGPLSLMSCVRESSPPQDVGTDFENEKNVGSKKKFWNPKKWFKRKHKVIEDGSTTIEIPESNKETTRSRSTSELSVSEDPVKRRSSTSMHPGLSVSHDSVFHSPHSGSELELDNAQSSSSLSIPHPQQQDLRFQTELSERLRSRRGHGDTSEDDEGLPHSPCNSPTTTEGLLEKTAIKDHPTKSHSTCSDGSLLSMGSSEMDEDSFGQQSRYSSKVSLHEKRSTEADSDLELGTVSSAPLNHSAAHHRVAVRPKRTHGAPRRKRVPQLSVSALPATPEVNEDISGRSLTPEGASKKETVNELYSSTSNSRMHSVTETQLKCSSLPPGLAGPGTDMAKLSRSCSNAGSKSTLGEEEEDREEKSDKSIFNRIFPRRSAKKKKSKQEEKEKISTSTTALSTQSYVMKYVESGHTSKTSVINNNKPIEKRPNVAPRSGAAARQRVQPIDIPASPDLNTRHEENVQLPKSSPDKSFSGSSPLQAELENHFRHKLTTNLSTSPPNFVISSMETPPQSPKSPIFVNNSPSPITSWMEQHTHYTKYSKQNESIRESRLEEVRSKVKFPGLSPLQERVLSSHHDDIEDNGFKSLTDLPRDVIKTNKPVAKSHSFKSMKPIFDTTDSRYSFNCERKEKKTIESERSMKKCEIKNQIFKAASLDSIKNLDAPPNTKTKISETKENFKETAEITISGPSHTAVVSVNNTDSVETKTHHNVEKQITEKESEIHIKEQQLSITKIQVKRDSTQISTNAISFNRNPLPEFLNKPLNKIENRPLSNVIFTTSTPRIIDEQSRPKTLFNFDGDKNIPSNIPRKFSKEDVEIVDKEISEEIVEVPSKTTSALVTITSMTPQLASRIYKKHSESQRKSSVASIPPESPIKEKPPLKFKFGSLEFLDGIKKSPDTTDVSDKSSQDSLDKLDVHNGVQENGDSVVLRRKSLINKRKTDDEPELMKVFARRSLKLKDSDVDNVSKQIGNMIEDSSNDTNTKSRDSDKENHVDSPPEERRKSLSVKEITKAKDTQNEITERRKSITTKEPLTETKFVESAEVTLRKPTNNKTFAYQRAVISHIAKPVEVVNTELKIKKQASFNDRPKTESWLTNVKNQETEKSDKEENIVSHEIIKDISPKNNFVNEDFQTKPKNFNQRKAEWEKRAQEASKKTVP